jgi:hypothetical protein
MAETERVYRAECGQCCAAMTTSDYVLAEDWADDHVTETGHAVSLNHEEGPL